MSRCVLNVAVGGWYPQGQQRLLDSLKSVGYTGHTLVWTEAYPPGSPTHAQLPYGFKAYALAAAVAAGHDSLLWLDASCWAVKPVEPLFDEIEREGHCFSTEVDPRFSTEPWKAGQWLKDEALATLGITRDEAMTIPLLGGMFMGVCLKHERSKRWLDDFIRICQDGHTLVGAMRNVGGSVSKDPRCLGHVADQAIAAVLAHRYGMALTNPPVWRDWYRPDIDERTVITARGM